MKLTLLKTPLINKSALAKAARMDYASLMRRIRRGAPELTERERRAIIAALSKANITMLEHG